MELPDNTENEPFFITEEIEAEMQLEQEFTPPPHVSTTNSLELFEPEAEEAP
ncbi:hypothetical protein [Pseudomonas jilinensis]|uniref:hypothetical protein n=1 Tax=Pseudomonas jilinensis TaxID=2078689 RepID=UPI0013EEF46F|nr:hypothetical protein [Pseudomonas jilinensis]MDD3764399.1 hypothetical protein [Nevskiales bacterium]